MTDFPYLIWSNEHRAWWRPDRQGYTKRVADAGRYSEAEALEICANAIPGRQPNAPLPEVPVPLQLVEACFQHFKEKHAGRDPDPPGDD
jgi:hypothetical protein